MSVVVNVSYEYYNVGGVCDIETMSVNQCISEGACISHNNNYCMPLLLLGTWPLLAHYILTLRSYIICYFPTKTNKH